MTTAFGSGEVERFRGIVAGSLGLRFDDSKLGFLGDVLRRRLDAARGDCANYLRRIERDLPEEEADALARELTVGETYFFRNRDQFRAFSEVVVPGRLQGRSGERRLRFLSAGCSSGEEAYSLAILLREAVTDPHWSVDIRAVDVNPAALQKAAGGRYSDWALRDTPPDIRSKWFRGEGRQMVLDEDVRRSVAFERRNLVANDPDLWRAGSYDAVFCRNVIMYFAPEIAQLVVERIARALVPGGYLFLGHAETLRGLSQDFHLRHTHGTFYYQRRGAEEAEAALPPVLRGMPAAAGKPAATNGDSGFAWADVIGGAAERIRALGEAPGRRSPRPAPSLPRPKWNLVQALDLLQRERFAEALDLIRALPDEAAHDPDVLLLTAVLLAHSGELAAAADMASRLLAIDELNAGARYVLALTDEGRGDRAGAISHDQVAVYLDPSFAMPKLHLGLMARRAGDREQARRELGQALLLLQREEASRLLLFGGGFNREGLIALCRAELRASEDG